LLDIKKGSLVIDFIHPIFYGTLLGIKKGSLVIDLIHAILYGTLLGINKASLSLSLTHTSLGNLLSKTFQQNHCKIDTINYCAFFGHFLKPGN
jgi:hypothetical protein